MRYTDKAEVVAAALRPDDEIAIKVVAVIGWGNDWAAYWAPSDWDDDDVRDRGHKISREAAEALFPCCVWSGRVYRD